MEITNRVWDGNVTYVMFGTSSVWLRWICYYFVLYVYILIRSAISSQANNHLNQIIIWNPHLGSVYYLRLPYLEQCSVRNPNSTHPNSCKNGFSLGCPVGFVLGTSHGKAILSLALMVRVLSMVQPEMAFSARNMKWYRNSGVGWWVGSGDMNSNFWVSWSTNIMY